jgi:hypothetical protein
MYTCPGCNSTDGKEGDEYHCLYCGQPMLMVLRDMPPAISNMNQRDIAQGTTQEWVCSVCGNPPGESTRECDFCGTI